MIELSCKNLDTLMPEKTDMRPENRRKRGGSKRAREKQAASGFNQMPFSPQNFPYKPVELIDDKSIDKIHKASLDILANQGIRVLEPKARKIMSEHGAHVDEETNIVQFSAQLIEDHNRHHPALFYITRSRSS